MEGHPGNEIMIIFVLMGFLAGFIRNGNFLHGFLGALSFIIFFGPMYLHGAWGRGESLAKRKKKESE